MGTMHGGMVAAKSLNQRLSGATGEDGREIGSEAEGKIETDFLAGVKIIEGQMI